MGYLGFRVKVDSGLTFQKIYLENVLVTVAVFTWAFLSGVRICVRSVFPNCVSHSNLKLKTAKHTVFPSAFCTVRGRVFALVPHPVIEKFTQTFCLLLHCAYA